MYMYTEGLLFSILQFKAFTCVPYIFYFIYSVYIYIYIHIFFIYPLKLVIIVMRFWLFI